MNYWYIILFHFIFIISQIFNAPVCADPWTLEQLKTYWLRQKDFRYGADPKFPGDILKEYKNLAADFSIKSEYTMIPSAFAPGIHIPTVIFIPKSYEENKTLKYPTIIRTHGGPATHTEYQTPNVEVAYWLSQGFVVVCPNYRGSDGFGEAYEKAIIGHPEVALQDIYDTGLYMRKQPYTDSKKKLILTGLSYGSYLNALLISQLGSDHYPDRSLFAGVHLLSGTYNKEAKHSKGEDENQIDQVEDENVQPPSKYSTSPETILSNIPENLPIFIAHGLKDGLSLPKQAITYTKKLIENGKNVVDAVFVKKGGHHLTSVRIEKNADENGLFEYIEHFAHFFGSFINKPFLKIFPTMISEGIKGAEEKLHHIEVKRKWRKEFAQNVIAGNYRGNSSLQDTVINEQEFPASPILQGQTVNFLRLVLGKEYQENNLPKNIQLFFEKYYFPKYTAEELSKYPPAAELYNLVENIILKEEKLLQNPIFKYVGYHATDGKSTCLYTFYSLWQHLLKGDFQAASITALRPFTDIFENYDNIDKFYDDMKQIEKANASYPNELLNNIRMYSKYATAQNPFLLSSYNDKTSNSWDYFLSKRAARDMTVEAFSDFFKRLGIYNEERVKKYLAFLEKNHPSSLTLTAYSEDDSSYLAIRGGEKLAVSLEKESLPTAKPSIMMKAFRQNPKATEQSLSEQPQAFTILPTLRDNFGKKEEGFLYSDCMQLRCLAYPKGAYHREVYLTFPFLEENLQVLKNLIFEDMQEWLVAKTYLGNLFKFSSPVLEDFGQYYDVPSTKEVSPLEKKPFKRRMNTQQLASFIHAGNISEIKAYFQDKNPKYINMPIDHSKTALDVAWDAKNPKSMKWLLSHGAHFKQSSGSLTNIIDWMNKIKGEQGSDLINLLLETFSGSLLNKKISEYFTPFMLAIKSGKTPLVDKLFSQGADINVITASGSAHTKDWSTLMEYSALTIAIEDCSSPNMFAFLLNKGLPLDLHRHYIRQNNKRTLLNLAIAKDLFFNKEEDGQDFHKDGFTKLLLKAGYNLAINYNLDVESIEVLLHYGFLRESGFHRNYKDKDGNPLLLQALKRVDDKYRDNCYDFHLNKFWPR